MSETLRLDIHDDFGYEALWTINDFMEVYPNDIKIVFEVQDNVFSFKDFLIHENINL